MRRNVTEAYVIQPVLKALRVLEVVAASPVPLTLKQVAADAGLAKTTAFKHVQTLRRAGYVAQEAAGDRIALGVRFWLLSGRGSPFARLREMALPIMTRLRDRWGETVNLATLESDEIVYIAVVESRRSLRTHARNGGSDPALATAVGQAMIAALPDRELARALDLHAPGAGPERVAAEQAIAAARRNGWAVDDGIAEEGVRCVGVAGVVVDGWPIAGISLSGPATRIADAQLIDIAQSLREGAAMLARCLAG